MSLTPRRLHAAAVASASRTTQPRWVMCRYTASGRAVASAPARGRMSAASTAMAAGAHDQVRIRLLTSDAADCNSGSDPLGSDPLGSDPLECDAIRFDPGTRLPAGDT